MKTLFGLSERLLHDKLEVASEVTAYRAPTAAIFALLVVVVFLWAAEVWGLATGVIAGLLALCLPRAFFHAGLASFDAPIATLWVATIWAYWRALRSWRWAIVAGVLWGCALATKHNAFLLPFALAPHWIYVAIRRRGLRGLWPVIPAMIVLGPLTLIALWPWLWFDTHAHLEAWLRFHMNHVHYNFEYLGDNWNHPPFPWHVALVTTLLTVPLATLASAALGSGVSIRRAIEGQAPDADTAPGILLFCSAAVAMGPFFLGSTPIFGAEKHWAAAIPSLCIAAAVGAVWAAQRAAAAVFAARPAFQTLPRLELGAVVLAGAILVVPAAVETCHAQPRGLTHYNAIAGGAPGGADLGMNRQFWGEAARGVLPFLRTRTPGLVYSHDASPAWGVYLRDGLLPRTYSDAGREDHGVNRSQLAIVVHEKHFNRHDYMIWAAYGTVRPVFVLRVDGVPVVTVYERPPR
jgi:4-amino-4-deoxy-L-arabinose transferase-like glycosyltransferase